MSKRTLYTNITPLPPTISRQTAVEVLHDHAAMIQLNPLVINFELCRAPPQAASDEYHSVWYELTDRISYLPGVKGRVSYKACFHDLPRGLQTHVYAPAGLDIKEKWTIGGNEPGEEREVLELGLVGVPREGLYLREDVDMHCNLLLTTFVKKNLKKAHGVLVDRLVVKADLADDSKLRSQYTASSKTRSWPPSIRSSSSVYSAPSVAGYDQPASPNNPGIPEMPGDFWPPPNHLHQGWSDTDSEAISSHRSSGTNIYISYDAAGQPSPRFAPSPVPHVGGQQGASPRYAPRPDSYLPATAYRPPPPPGIAELSGENNVRESYRPWRRDSSQIMEAVKERGDVPPPVPAKGPGRRV